jgi:hypothetical protein
LIRAAVAVILGTLFWVMSVYVGYKIGWQAGEEDGFASMNLEVIEKCRVQ